MIDDRRFAVRRAQALGVVALLTFATGCSFFSKSQSRFYSLDRLPPAGAASASAPAPASTTGVRATPLGIDGIELPPGLDRREIVVRKADHQTEIRSAEQWSAGFQELALHTLAFDLADRLPEGSVILPGEAKPLAPMRSIDVVFEELAAGPESAVVLDARWVLRENGRPDVTHHERLTVAIPSLKSADVATGVSQALAMLADRMAAQVGAP